MVADGDGRRGLHDVVKLRKSMSDACASARRAHDDSVDEDPGTAEKCSKIAGELTDLLAEVDGVAADLGHDGRPAGEAGDGDREETGVQDKKRDDGDREPTAGHDRRLGGRLSEFENLVNMKISDGDFAHTMVIVDKEDSFPVVTVLSDEPVSALEDRCRMIGGKANVFISDGDGGISYVALDFIERVDGEGR